MSCSGDCRLPLFRIPPRPEWVLRKYAAMIKYKFLISRNLQGPPASAISQSGANTGGPARGICTIHPGRSLQQCNCIHRTGWQESRYVASSTWTARHWRNSHGQQRYYRLRCTRGNARFFPSDYWSSESVEWLVESDESRIQRRQSRSSTSSYAADAAAISTGV